ncbi:PAS domain S-box-containing protein [Daejeonella lutea]|uniref:PAS domain S-box-containing protein n=2 Tax=Daejeonella lutea TaxID=572036 RepID=A0A1T5AZ95_9SPHI|nr:PAS domain S-box-containing protein [Daejeonella lutea]
MVFDLEFFFEISPDLLCIYGFDGYFKKINPAVSKTLGYDNTELFSSQVSSFVHPEDLLLSNHKMETLIDGHSLLNFENRYLHKDGSVVWLSWTSVPIKKDEVIFGIAKDITYKKQLEEYDRISSVLGMINDDHHKRFKKIVKNDIPKNLSINGIGNIKRVKDEPTYSDQFWLNQFEAAVRKHAGKIDLNLELISGELALSQRQLFRRVNLILGITPNKLVRVIRLQLAWEAIASGKYRTIKEIANIAGYSSRTHFSKLFREVYGINVSDLL